MPSEKRRPFDDTWKKDELEKSVKDAKEKSRKSKGTDEQKDRRSSDKKKEDVDGALRKHKSDPENRSATKKRDESDKHEKRRDDPGDRKRVEKHHRDESDKQRNERDKKHREGDKKTTDDDRERRHRDEREKRHPDNDRDKMPKDDRERRHREDETKKTKDDRDKRHRDNEPKRHRDDEHRDRKYVEVDRKERQPDREKRHDVEERRNKDDRRREGDEGLDRSSQRDRDQEREERRRRKEEELTRRKRQKEEEEMREEEEERRKLEQLRQDKRRRSDDKDKDLKKDKKREPQGSEVGNSEKDKYQDADNDGEQDYEDDFENYDEDFEDDNNSDTKQGDNDDNSSNEESKRAQPPLKKPISEMDQIRSAMRSENQKIDSAKKVSRFSDDSDDEGAYEIRARQTHSGNDDLYSPDEGRNSLRAKPSGRSFINFVSARQKEVSSKAASRVRQRQLEISQLIDFDYVEYSLFDMPPVSEYELYMRTYGGSNAKQAYVQTNEDNVEREIQTEDIEFEDKWCQHPPDDFACVGGPNTKANSEEKSTIDYIDTLAMTKFLGQATKVMLAVLEESVLEQQSYHKSTAEPGQKKSDIVLSGGFVELQSAKCPLLTGRYVVKSIFATLQTQVLLTVHSPCKQQSSEVPYSSAGIICVWSASEPARPLKILATMGCPTCACFSPYSASLVFAGLDCGTLDLWDTREPNSSHKEITHNGEGWVVRFPTYVTAGIRNYENHASPVVAVQTISSGDLRSDTGGKDSLSFQVASIEEFGVINLWVVSELRNRDADDTSSDLGLSPTGRIRLIKSTTIKLQSPAKFVNGDTCVLVTGLYMSPHSNSHYFVTCNIEAIIHGVTYGGNSAPKFYKRNADLLNNGGAVISIDFSPFIENKFLAGYSDGCVCLFDTNYRLPLAAWQSITPQNVPVQTVRWCRSRPSVFFALLSTGQLQVWDLLSSNKGPVNSQVISENRITSFELSNDYKATGIGQLGRKPQLVLAFENAITEVHVISKEFSDYQKTEEDQFKLLLQSGGCR